MGDFILQYIHGGFYTIYIHIIRALGRGWLYTFFLICCSCFAKMQYNRRDVFLVLFCFARFFSFWYVGDVCVDVCVCCWWW